MIGLTHVIRSSGSTKYGITLERCARTSLDLFECGIADQRPPWCDTRPSGCLYITRQIAGRHVIALARDNDLRTDLQSPRGPSEGGQTKANREKSRTCADPHWTAPVVKQNPYMRRHLEG